jgi:hypothetical protein
LILNWSRGGSNSRPSHCERDALPAELRPLLNQHMQQIHAKFYYGFLRKASSAAVDSRPSMILRCGKRPNSLMTRK